MPKTIYYAASTLTGHLADEDGSLDWLMSVDAGASPENLRFMDRVGCLIEGSVTYAWCLAHGETDFTGGRMPTFVFTSRQLKVPEGADLRFVSGDVRPVHAAATSLSGGKDLWVVGGGELAGQFLDAGLLDEIQVSIAPTALPDGAPLLPRRTATGQLQLRDVRQTGQLAHLTYDVIRTG